MTGSGCKGKVEVLTGELSALYRYFLSAEPGIPSTLPLQPLPVNYIDYALWQQESLTGQRIERLLNYWRNELRGIRALELPTDHPRPAHASYRGSSIPIRIDPQLVDRLEALAQENHSTLQMLLLAAFETLLYRHSHQEEFAVGIPFAGRND
ncbi:MAG: condensation domain-containing protein, partial [Pirellulaceae bacterium]